MPRTFLAKFVDADDNVVLEAPVTVYDPELARQLFISNFASMLPVITQGFYSILLAATDPELLARQPGDLHAVHLKAAIRMAPPPSGLIAADGATPEQLAQRNRQLRNGHG